MRRRKVASVASVAAAGIAAYIYVRMISVEGSLEVHVTMRGSAAVVTPWLS